MGERLVWKQTRREITQVPLSSVIDELARKEDLTPEQITRHLLEQKKSLHVPGAKYHIWRDSLSV